MFVRQRGSEREKRVAESERKKRHKGRSREKQAAVVLES